MGWDGAGSAALTLDGTLRMAASMTIETLSMGVSYLEPGTPIWGETSGFTAEVEYIEQVARTTTTTTWHVHLRHVVGVPVADETILCPPVYRPQTSYPETFDPNVHDHDDPRWNLTTVPAGAIISIVSVAMPKIAPFVSGIYGAGNPTVTAAVTLGSTFVLDLSRVDLLEPGTYDLIVATTLNLGSWTPPAGVSKVGAGTLRLTV